MKLARYYDSNSNVVPAVFTDENTLADCSSFGEDWNEQFFGNDGLTRLASFLESSGSGLPTVAAADVKLAPAVARPSKIICIGLNYSDHAAETGAKVPKEPILFGKATSAVVGPNDDVIIPRASVKTDWEVELGVVIGSPAKYVSEADALNHVAGYCVINDVSEREFQTERSGQWIKGKSCDTFGPTGPWLVTPDEVGDPQNLDMYLDVDGQRMQTGNTKTMVYGVAHLVSYLSQFFTLHTGDVISTGTPPGVGMGMKPEPVYLKAGQTMTLGIQNLGTQTQNVKADQ